MRTMYDSVRADGCPSDGQLLAGYVDGDFPSYAGMLPLANGRKVLSITITGLPAHLYDVEFGAGTPAGAAQWVIRQRVAGFIPTIYTSLSNVPTVLAECKRLGVVLPVQFSVAAWDGSPNFPAPMAGVEWMSKQYLHDLHDRGLNYDVSSVVDFWPGVDTGLDPQGGGTLLGGFLMALSDAEQTEALAILREWRTREGKFDTEFFAINNSILPAVASLGTKVTALQTAVSNISVGGGSVDVDALATALAGALGASLPAAVVAALAQKLGA